VQEVAIYEKSFFFSKIFSNCLEDLSTLAGIWRGKKCFLTQQQIHILSRTWDISNSDFFLACNVQPNLNTNHMQPTNAYAFNGTGIQRLDDSSIS